MRGTAKRRAGVWVLATVCLGFTSLGVDTCPAMPDVLSRVAEALGQHERRLDHVESCTCCCDGVLAPVCARDGKTYVNACEARCASAEVASRGECRADACGGPEGLSCRDGRFCELPPGCDAMAFGVCEERPEVCPRIFAPVCGCDGETYANDCERASAGVPLRHEGACEDPPAECAENADCGPDDFCRKEPGRCGAAGTCQERPLGCPDVFEPVCGCDGTTYSNACDAAAAGVSVAQRGACEEPPVACEPGDDCGPGRYCAPPPGRCDEAGTCEPRADVCPQVYAPVCGCDGRTYGNACEAAQAGVGVARRGACEEPPGTCEDDDDCRADDFCATRPGHCDSAGACRPRPEDCPLVFACRFVCGCDGESYCTACEAAAAGASIAHEGRCERGDDDDDDEDDDD